MNPEERIIQADRSVVIAADVGDGVELMNILDAIREIPGIKSLKIGIDQGLRGLESVVATIKSHNLVVIYDHQKAGNDIPDMGANFAKKLKAAQVDAAILFPFAGPATQEAWTKACFDADLQVITGGIMTHPKFLASEGGYISDDAPFRIFQLACELGVRNFVVPGNKLPWVTNLRSLLVQELGEGNFALYAPGFITQGGDISECGKAAGPYFHAIVGSAVYKKPGIEAKRLAAIEVTKNI